MNDDLLELSSIAPKRKAVPLKWPENPEGEMVELAIPQDFGAVDHAELERDRIRMESLRMKKDLGPDLKGEIGMLLDRLARRLIIGGPDEAIKALPESTKLEVANRFFSEQDSKLLRMAEGMDEETMQHLLRLGGFMPGSSDSTEATQSSGGE